ncbi:MAG: alginate export family protein [Cyclobacteriaceae bacterium]
MTLKPNQLILVALTALLAISAVPAFAQFTIVGEIRPRAEFRNGFKSLTTDDTDAAFFVEQRSRLYLWFKDPKYSFQLTLQDVRLWGENSQIYKSDNSLFNVYEAWGAYHFSDNFLFKAGRQALNYDNARILGDLAWAQQARSHDLLKAEYSANDFSFHIGAAFNQEDVLSRPEPARLVSTFYQGVNNYKTMQFLWLNKKYEKGTVSLLLLNNGIQAADSSVNFSQTYGLYAKNNLGKLSLTTELYIQSGKTASGQELFAGMGAIAADLKTGSSVIGIGGDYLSGSDFDESSGNSFTPLYGTNHKFYGFMDYFYVGNPFGDVGLIDLYVKLKFALGEKSSLVTFVHNFSAGVDMSENYIAAQDNQLGTEVDIVYNLNIDKAVNLKVGYSQMFASENMELLKTGDSNATNNWAWAMLTIKPQLFKSGDKDK